MSLAVVFDSAGTLMRTIRMGRNILTGELVRDLETTMLTFADPERALCVIHAHAQDIMNAPAGMLFSQYMIRHNVRIGIACTRHVVEINDICQMIRDDTMAKVGDMQECMKIIWSQIRDEEMVSLNNGVIVHTGHKCIEFTISAGGTPFSGACDTICTLHQMGIATYIASGDRETKLEKMAGYLGIPTDRVFGVATPTIKAQIVRDLKEQYDRVIMVGDSINDLLAMRASDLAVLSYQQSDDKPPELAKIADHKIMDVREVVEIAKNFNS